MLVLLHTIFPDGPVKIHSKKMQTLHTVKHKTGRMIMIGFIIKILENKSTFSLTPPNQPPPPGPTSQWSIM